MNYKNILLAGLLVISLAGAVAASAANNSGLFKGNKLGCNCSQGQCKNGNCAKDCKGACASAKTGACNCSNGQCKNGNCAKTCKGGCANGGTCSGAGCSATGCQGGCKGGCAGATASSANPLPKKSCDCGKK